MFTDFDLHPTLFKAVEKLGYAEPSEVQYQSIPQALDKKDLLVSAQTGSGKTAAFMLPLLHLMLTGKNKPGPKALIVAPTRELVRQIFKQFTLLAQFTPVQAAMLTGGDDFKYQASLLRKNPEIIISTPGRLVDHLKRGSTDLEDVEVFVLDEADRMLDMGFSEDMMCIAAGTGAIKATWLYSATLGHAGVTDLGKSLLINPEQINIAGARDQHADIEQQMILADDEPHKNKMLQKLVEQNQDSKVVVFTNTKIMAEKVGSFLRLQSNEIGVLQGDMNQDERNFVTQKKVKVKFFYPKKSKSEFFLTKKKKK